MILVVESFIFFSLIFPFCKSKLNFITVKVSIFNKTYSEQELETLLNTNEDTTDLAGVSFEWNTLKNNQNSFGI